jgi:hypothetical protein
MDSRIRHLQRVTARDDVEVKPVRQEKHERER